MSVVLPSPQQPRKVARKMVHAKYSHLNRHMTLRYWRGGWQCWQGSRWVEIESTAVREAAYDFTEDAVFKAHTKADEELERDWNPDSSKVRNLLDATQALVLLPETVESPSWLGDAPTDGVMVSCRNGLLDVSSRELLEHTPTFFNRTAVPFDYDPDAPRPERWLKFLDALWPDDPECIAALQEWFGYVVSGRTDLQKIVLMVGPPRGGKGTITTVISEMVGTGNVAAPTISSLTGEFGLGPLLNASLATITDARISGRGNAAVVERLLSISGEDAMTVNRKFRDQWTGRIPARFMLCSNELPQFGDASGALASRFLSLRLTKSWHRNEDRTLIGALRGELPGILNWALDGLERLTNNGHFTEPQSSRATYETLVEMSSPIAAFIAERCNVADPSARTPSGAVWLAWQEWADAHGHHAGTTATLGRDLAAQVHGLKTIRSGSDGQRCQVYSGLELLDNGGPAI